MHDPDAENRLIAPIHNDPCIHGELHRNDPVVVTLTDSVHNNTVIVHGRLHNGIDSTSPGGTTGHRLTIEMESLENFQRDTNTDPEGQKLTVHTGLVAGPSQVTGRSTFRQYAWSSDNPWDLGHVLSGGDVQVYHADEYTDES